eukprot:3278247-Pleurochrysis_carterae.AAC.1
MLVQSSSRPFALHRRWRAAKHVQTSIQAGPGSPNPSPTLTTSNTLIVLPYFQYRHIANGSHIYGVHLHDVVQSPLGAMYDECAVSPYVFSLRIGRGEVARTRARPKPSPTRTN